MSKILSYSDNTTGSDWISKEPYTDDDIAKITDPNGGMNEYPRTAIPSPFARLDLLANAFATLSETNLQGTKMDLRLVSNALDIAQLLFDFDHHSHYLRILRWNPQSKLAALEAEPSQAHKLLAQTLRLFMESDREAYNFSLTDDWYILSYRNQIIGSTSPATLTMGAPLTSPIAEIMVEEGEPLFGNIRHLWQRDCEFVVYIVHLFNAFPDLRKRLKAVYAYILTNLELARKGRPELYDAVRERVGNPQALNMETAASLAAQLPTLYSEFTTENAPRIFTHPLFVRRSGNLLQAAENSDFRIVPAKKLAEGETLPLILRAGFHSPSGETFTYVNRPWNENTKVDTLSLPPQERVLPDTSLAYPWLTSSDFLEESIIQLATPIDGDHFHNGNPLNAATGSAGYLLPIKPLYFHYFPAATLAANVAPGKKVTELRTNANGSVTFILRIPIRKNYIELQRTYRRADTTIDTSTPAGEDGIIIESVRMSTGIFPFARTGERDIYNVRLFQMMPDHTIGLTFLTDDTSAPTSPSVREPAERSKSKMMRTSYYDVDFSFTHIRATITSSDLRNNYSAVILPLWPDYTPGSAKFLFAVDFGTTNSHIEYSVDHSPACPLSFRPSTDATLVATLDAPGSLAQSEAMLDVEFIPREIGSQYSFPMRTALSENLYAAASRPEILRNINIPFLYERKAFNGYKINTMLKWADKTDLSEQYLREIMLLIRARVILSRGDLSNTQIVYFYPVSMKRSLQLRYLTLWEELYTRYIDSSEIKVHAYPESVAPAFYYNNVARDGSNFVSIDIGGGTSDVVIYKADDERMKSNLHIISSFRFAGNTIFGDGFTSADADHNPLIEQYADYFSKLVRRDSRLAYLDVILRDIIAGKRSEDINAFLFSIENAELLHNLSPIDRRAYSYNALLGNDECRKVIFVYFLTAIIYYVARLMHDSNLEMPKQICFSGTGSKILNIVGRPEVVEELARDIIEKVYGRHYGSFELKMERQAPKQITCKGGIELQHRIEAGKAGAGNFASREIMQRKFNSTLTPTEAYTYSSIRSLQHRSEIEEAVKQFNTFFLSLLTNERRDELGIPKDAADYLSAHLNDDISSYLAAGIEALLPLEEGSDEAVEDVPFFYPIAGIIRNNLIMNLRPGKLKRAADPQ